MSLTSYSSLQAEVADWLNRTDLTSVIPTFISLAEERVRTENLPYNRKQTLTINAQTVDLPSDCKVVEHLYYDDAQKYGPLFIVPPDQLPMHTRGATGVPLYAAQVERTTMIFAPTPDTSYTAQIIYRTTVDALSATNTTNWLLATYPSLYLWGALVEAEKYLKNDERVALWDASFVKALEQARRDLKKQAEGGGPMSIKVPSNRVIGG